MLMPKQWRPTSVFETASAPVEASTADEPDNTDVTDMNDEAETEDHESAVDDQKTHVKSVFRQEWLNNMTLWFWKWPPKVLMVGHFDPLFWKLEKTLHESRLYNVLLSYTY